MTLEETHGSNAICTKFYRNRCYFGSWHHSIFFFLQWKYANDNLLVNISVHMKMYGLDLYTEHKHNYKKFLFYIEYIRTVWILFNSSGFLLEGSHERSHNKTPKHTSKQNSTEMHS